LFSMNKTFSKNEELGITDFLEGVPSAEPFNYIFTALRGIQSGREYYVTMCPLHLIPKLFLYDEKELPPSLRAQRTLNRSRIPKMSRYLVDNPKSYIFSALTASIDGRVEFKPFTKTGAASKVGYLIVPMSARFLINDGQHRRAAIERALKVNPDLGSETISVVFFVDAGLKRSQQMFADLNKHAVRPTLSLSVLYDHRDPLARLSVRLAMGLPIFSKRTEFEKTTISNRSTNLFTLSSIYHATKLLLGKGQNEYSLNQEEEDLAFDFWTEVTDNIREWKLLLENKISSSELRKGFINSHGIALLALGKAGQELIQKFPEKWKNKVEGLKKIDWSRSNTKLWEGRAMHAGRINASSNNVLLTTMIIKRALGLKLKKEDEELEQRLFRASKEKI
jgi:DNA sulfur modification protein DndB